MIDFQILISSSILQSVLHKIYVLFFTVQTTAINRHNLLEMLMCNVYVTVHYSVVSKEIVYL